MGRVIKKLQNSLRIGRFGLRKTGCIVMFGRQRYGRSVSGVGEPECVINTGVSGPGVVKKAVERVGDGDFGLLAETIKKTAFKITRMGELVGREAARRLNVPFGIVDISLAPTPAVGDSVAEILEAMGLGAVVPHGTTAALALLNDAVKGRAMASVRRRDIGGIYPVSEDEGTIQLPVKALCWKSWRRDQCLLVGLDMIACRRYACGNYCRSR